MKRYQIFISSTYTDLKLEREAVLQNVLKLQHIPIGMEYFVSANEEQFNYIKRLLNETDYYIIIIGNRYGSVAADGISYTEKEFDYAVNLGIPVIACIHSNPDSLPINRCDTDPIAKKKLKKFRNKIMNHRMVSCLDWNNPEALSTEIVVALVNTIERYPRPGWERVISYENSDSLNPRNDSREVEFQTDENFPEEFILLPEHENGKTAHIEWESTPNFFHKYLDLHREGKITIGEVSLSFFNGSRWLTDNERISILNEICEENIPCRILINGESESIQAVHQNMMKNEQNTILPEYPPVSQGIKLWNRRRIKCSNIKIRISLFPLLHSYYHIKLTDNKSKSAIRVAFYRYGNVDLNSCYMKIFDGETKFYESYCEEFKFLWRRAIDIDKYLKNKY